MWVLPLVAVLQDKSALAWALYGLQFLQEISNAPVWCPLQAAVCISTLVWSFPQAALVPQPSSPFFSDLAVCTVVSLFYFLFFSSSFPSDRVAFLPFLKYVSTEVPHTWLVGSTIPWGGSVVGLSGTCCVCAAPSLFSQRPPYSTSTTEILPLSIDPYKDTGMQKCRSLSCSNIYTSSV